jgi:hypothetical protein
MGYMKREWVYHSKIRTFFWDRDSYSRMLNRTLEDDDDFVEWCEEHSCNVDQTWVECPDDETVTMFILRWA